MDWNSLLAEQLDWHWREQLRPRLDGLTDAEYRWEPVAGAWNVRPRGTGTAPIGLGAGEFTLDFARPQPVPPPVTTIAWRLGHIIVGVLGMRTASHFGGPALDYDTHRYPGDAATALAQLDTAYAGWVAGVRGLGADGLARPCGPGDDMAPWAGPSDRAGEREHVHQDPGDLRRRRPGEAGRILGPGPGLRGRAAAGGLRELGGLRRVGRDSGK